MASAVRPAAKRTREFHQQVESWARAGKGATAAAVEVRLFFLFTDCVWKFGKTLSFPQWNEADEGPSCVSLRLMPAGLRPGEKRLMIEATVRFGTPTIYATCR